MSLFCLHKQEKTGNQGITPEYAVVTFEMGKIVPHQKFTGLISADKVVSISSITLIEEKHRAGYMT